jgi:hypothetical protein
MPSFTSDKPTSVAPATVHESSAAVPPCFFWPSCLERAALEKAGRSVCHRCAVRLRGAEYPLRGPCAQPLYLTGRVAAEALDMLEE